ncbi:hypothetical protein [Actinoallomurus sp. CA-150999]|uniref:hypothetical protein n=1 Tax=Actinoallomurus sp. CA-150999 TaxID=3239887 RepID=UPI003D8FA79A
MGAGAAATVWRKHLMSGVGRKASPASINQALAAVTLLYAQAVLRIDAERAHVPKSGEPDALSHLQQGAVERASAPLGSA